MKSAGMRAEKRKHYPILYLRGKTEVKDEEYSKVYVAPTLDHLHRD